MFSFDYAIGHSQWVVSRLMDGKLSGPGSELYLPSQDISEFQLKSHGKKAWKHQKSSKRMRRFPQKDFLTGLLVEDFLSR